MSNAPHKSTLNMSEVATSAHFSVYFHFDNLTSLAFNFYTFDSHLEMTSSTNKTVWPSLGHKQLDSWCLFYISPSSISDIFQDLNRATQVSSIIVSCLIPSFNITDLIDRIFLHGGISQLNPLSNPHPVTQKITWSKTVIVMHWIRILFGILY